MIAINDLKRGFELYQEEYEKKAIEVLRSGWYVLGKEVSEFETEFAEYVGIRYCIGVDNGLNAIALGIKALNISEGDEVIVTANTYIATVLGISHNRATPIFVDADKFHNIDAEKIEAAITDRTKAVLITHLYGQSCEMKRIKEICDNYNLILLEDCAQSHGAAFDGKKVGTFGKMGFYSFYPTKNIGAFGDAGAVVTNDEELEKKIRALRNYGSLKRYENEYEGNNSRLDEIQAGLLRVKLSHIDELTKQRTDIAQRYLKEINNSLIELPKVQKGSTHVFHLFVVQTDERNKFREYMKENEISTDVHYPMPPYLAKPYLNLGYKREDFPMTELLYSKIVSIPIFNGMRKDEVDKVINIINNFSI